LQRLASLSFAHKQKAKTFLVSSVLPTTFIFYHFSPDAFHWGRNPNLVNQDSLQVHHDSMIGMTELTSIDNQIPDSQRPETITRTARVLSRTKMPRLRDTNYAVGETAPATYKLSTNLPTSLKPQ